MPLDNVRLQKQGSMRIAPMVPFGVHTQKANNLETDEHAVSRLFWYGVQAHIPLAVKYIEEVERTGIPCIAMFYGTKEH